MPERENYPLALPIAALLQERYRIEKVLGQGGFGITYLAKDEKLGKSVAIKEYFPSFLSTRAGSTVSSLSGESTEYFNYGITCFIQEAKTLAQFSNVRGVVNVQDYFEENGTAYFIMEYVDGIRFDEYIKAQGGKITMEKALEVLLPVMNALEVVHSQGIIHRDVTPDNIYITHDGEVKLLDFGAARYSLGDKSRSLDVVLKHGYAPKEQYSRRGRQGPYTDVYTLGVCFYVALTGKKPSDSIERLDKDDLIPPSQLGVDITDRQESAILTAMAVKAEQRFQNMTAFKAALLGIAQEFHPVEVAKPVQEVTDGGEDSKSSAMPSQETIGQKYSRSYANDGETVAFIAPMQMAKNKAQQSIAIVEDEEAEAITEQTAVEQSQENLSLEQQSVAITAHEEEMVAPAEQTLVEQSQEKQNYTITGNEGETVAFIPHKPVDQVREPQCATVEADNKEVLIPFVEEQADSNLSGEKEEEPIKESEEPPVSDVANIEVAANQEIQIESSRRKKVIGKRVTCLALAAANLVALIMYPEALFLICCLLFVVYAFQTPVRNKVFTAKRWVAFYVIGGIASGIMLVYDVLIFAFGMVFNIFSILEILIHPLAVFAFITTRKQQKKYSRRIEKTGSNE